MISYAVDIYFVVFIRNSFLSKNCVHEERSGISYYFHVSMYSLLCLSCLCVSWLRVLDLLVTETKIILLYV